MIVRLLIRLGVLDPRIDPPYADEPSVTPYSRKLLEVSSMRYR